MPPWRLTLITIMQFVENVSDHQAADAVRGHLDWKSVLSLELDHPGFDASVLTEFRHRLLAQDNPLLMLVRLLARCQELGLLYGIELNSKDQILSDHSPSER